MDNAWFERVRASGLVNRLLLVVGVTLLAASLQSGINNPQDPAYFLLFYPAVLVCAWFGGATAGVLATLSSCLLAIWFFMDPTHTVLLSTPRQAYSLAVFVAMGLAFSWWRGRLSVATGQVRRLAGEFDTERTRRADAEQLLERLRERSQDEGERLRRDLSLEIHDAVGATLTGIGMRLEVLRKEAERGVRIQPGELDDIRGLVGRAVASSREICTRLRPAMLDDLGLVETCRWYLQDWARNTLIRADAQIDGPLPALPDALAIDLFRVFQELLTNVARHSGATFVRVSLRQVDGDLRLVVRDNGRGLPPGPLPGLGLSGIQERLRRHGGRFAIESSSRGTAARVQVPLLGAGPLDR